VSVLLAAKAKVDPDVAAVLTGEAKVQLAFGQYGSSTADSEHTVFRFVSADSLPEYSRAQHYTYL
jgi:hypothetical protein